MELEVAIQNAIKKLEGENVDVFEVFGIARYSLAIEAKRHMVDSFRRSSSRGVAIRVVCDGRMGWSATTDISSVEINRTIANAIAGMKVASPSEEAVIVDPQAPDGGFYEQVGRSFGEIEDDEKIEKALTLESAAIAFDSCIARVRNPRYEEEIWQCRVVNSKGVSANARRGLVSAEVIAIASDENGSESAYEFDFSPRFEELDVEATARRASERAISKLGAVRIESASLPVIFDNRSASSILGILAPSFFADNIQRSKSALIGKRGKEMYSPLVTIVDDGLMPGGYGSFAFDGEGIPSQKTVMVDGGRIDAWLYDGPRAKKDNVPSTGNCRRKEISAVPAIGVTNCYLKAGDMKVDELASGIERGFFVTDLLGVHTANPISGDFSLGAEGFLIEDGRQTSPVRGITIAGNVHELFKKIVGVACDLKFFGSYGSPSVMVENLMLGG